MEVCQPLTEAASISCNAILQLARQLQDLRETDNPIKHFDDFEHAVNALFNQAQQDFLAESLADQDINVPAIELKGSVISVFCAAIKPIKQLLALFESCEHSTVMAKSNASYLWS